MQTVIRGALDAMKAERPAVEVPREALVKIAAELRRLGKLLDEERAWDPLDVARYLGTRPPKCILSANSRLPKNPS